jgi:hypothetical protein
MHSWFSNKIFDLSVISYRHEIFFCCNRNYCNETFAHGNIAHYQKIIVQLQHGLVQQNNICGNYTYCHKIVYEALEPTATK